MLLGLTWATNCFDLVSSIDCLSKYPKKNVSGYVTTQWLTIQSPGSSPQALQVTIHNRQMVVFVCVSSFTSLFGCIEHIILSHLTWWLLFENILKQHISLWYTLIRVSITFICKTNNNNCPVSWGYRIHWLHLCKGVRPPPKRVSWYMTLNNLMVRLQQCWSFGECRVPLHCHGPEW